MTLSNLAKLFCLYLVCYIFYSPYLNNYGFTPENFNQYLIVFYLVKVSRNFFLKKK